MIVFLCGPHCSGKTSLLKDLIDKSVINFRGSEIGKDLFYSRKFLPGGQGPKFEHEVTDKELERDQLVFQNAFCAGIETWHPGNLAYSLIRNPSCEEDLVRKMQSSPIINSTYGIWLRIPPEVIRKRTVTFKDNPTWAAQFYSEIDRKLGYCISRLNLKNRVTIIDASVSYEEVLSEVSRTIFSIRSTSTDSLL